MQFPGVFLEFRVGFQNNVVLVQLRVHGINLPLPECVIERVVDGRRSDAKSRSGGAINNYGFRHAAQLLIGCHVGKLRQFPKLSHQLADYAVQLILIRIFNGVLVFRAAHPIVHREILHRLHVKRDARNLGQFGA